MIRPILLLLLVIVVMFIYEREVSFFAFGETDSNLEYLDLYKIKDKNEGLIEPSGLALSHDGNALWTVSDNTEKVFKLSLDGKLQKSESFEITDRDLEGIALDASGKFLFVVKEAENEIIKINIAEQIEVDRKPLSEMSGYQVIAQYFQNSPPNKGLEGITWNIDTGSIFVLKEALPGLLIEVSADLTAIQNHILLAESNGFFDAKVSPNKLDFSGICYDQVRKQFWIVSDKGQKVFLFDHNQNRVIESFSLGYHQKSKHKKIKKAEGIALHPNSNHLFVVSDKEARLYQFSSHE